jgi:hypothetical protein
LGKSTAKKRGNSLTLVGDFSGKITGQGDTHPQKRLAVIPSHGILSAQLRYSIALLDRGSMQTETEDTFIKAKLQRWADTPDYQDKWIVYDGTDVSIVDHLSSTRHRSICLVKELACVLAEDAPLSIKEFLTADF